MTTETGSSMAGARVQFAITAGTATVDRASATTDTSGTASATVTLGASAGTVTVTATVAGTTRSAVFRTTVIATNADSTEAPTVYFPDGTEATHGKVAPNALGPNGEQAGATVLPTPTVFGNALQELKNHVANRKLIISGFAP